MDFKIARVFLKLFKILTNMYFGDKISLKLDYIQKEIFDMKTTLVIMAAGIGSRFGGGIKQLAPVGPSGEIIMDY